MAKKKLDTLLDESVVVEVVMRKEMSIGAYLKLMSNDKRKGWQVQAYQLGVYSVGHKKEV